MAELTEGLLNSPFFGLGLSAAAWCAGLWVQKKTGWVLCNPLLIAGLLIIAFLAAFHIPLEQYNIGGDMIKLMLGPVTAVLALNIYRQREILREHFLPVLAGCLAGSAVSLFSVLALCQVFQMEDPAAQKRHHRHRGGHRGEPRRRPGDRRRRCGSGRYHRRGMRSPVCQVVPHHRPGGGGAGHRRVQSRPGDH